MAVSLTTRCCNRSLLTTLWQRAVYVRYAEEIGKSVASLTPTEGQLAELKYERRTAFLLCFSVVLPLSCFTKDSALPCGPHQTLAFLVCFRCLASPRQCPHLAVLLRYPPPRNIGGIGTGLDPVDVAPAAAA